MPEGDGYVSIRLGGGPQAGKGGGCGGKKEARSPLKAHTAAPPLNDSNAAVGDSPLDAHSKPKALSNAAAASLPVCSGSEAGRAGGAACGGIEGDAAVKAQLADVFGRVAKEEAGPAAGGRGSSTQRGSRERQQRAGADGPVEWGRGCDGFQHQGGAGCVAILNRGSTGAAGQGMHFLALASHNLAPCFHVFVLTGGARLRHSCADAAVTALGLTTIAGGKRVMPAISNGHPRQTGLPNAA
eukprot:1158187-Pelagomonas_calceolata.AAC.11